jgi:UDP-GlcNAc:undecaprenyl-phosphate GlcNAc-1-phosphate transferase
VAIFVSAWAPIAVLVVLAMTLPQDWLAARFGAEFQAYVGGLQDRTVPALVILAGGLVLHLLGLYDDVRPLSAAVKLAVMLAVGVWVALVGHVRMAEFAGETVSVITTAVWIVLITNAFNFLDNMDGLSAGVACICMALLVACGLLAGQVLVPALGCVFLGAVVGFLVYNFPPARVFMGDAGSLLIGYMLAVLSIMTTYYESGQDRPPFALAMPVIILAVPLYDFVTVVMIRIREGRSPLQGDQRHFSHRLVEHGFSRRLAVLTIYLATLATGLGATLLPQAGLRETVTIAAVVVLVLAMVAILESPVRQNK